jgi:hypothetical protein
LTQLTTPDGRYLVVRGRLWRAANPNLPQEIRSKLVGELMDARRQVKAAGRSKDPEQLAAARGAVNAAKIALGERGPVWWTDGSKDFNRHLAKNTPYADWYSRVDVP